MGTEWPWKATNENYKSGTELIGILIETRAKGGNLLLNIGPKPDGEIPIEQESRLREIALWNFVNIESIKNLEQNLQAQGYELEKVPYVLQLNKRDLPTAIPTEEMVHVLRYKNEPVFEAVAFKGVGVFDTLKACAKQVLIELKKGR